FEDQNVTTTQSERACNGQSNDSRTDNNRVNLVHEESLASLKFDVASIARLQGAVFYSRRFRFGGIVLAESGYGAR
ncbi:MAG TPA: hypothetical protein VI653_19835, partial [Steroidobacteraceae bacterium]